MGWDGMGWDGMGWDGMGWDGMGRDGVRRSGVGDVNTRDGTLLPSPPSEVGLWGTQAPSRALSHLDVQLQAPRPQDRLVDHVLTVTKRGGVGVPGCEWPRAT